MKRDKYLAAFEVWLGAMRAGDENRQALANIVEPVWCDVVANADLPEEAEVDEFCLVLSPLVMPHTSVWIAIEKSNLLYRLLYLGESLRIAPCPQHKGHWSGDFGSCLYGCGMTGWLREKKMR